MTLYGQDHYKATQPRIQTLVKRKSVRHFLAKEVSFEDIKTILKTSARALAAVIFNLGKSMWLAVKSVMSSQLS